MPEIGGDQTLKILNTIKIFISNFRQASISHTKRGCHAERSEAPVSEGFVLFWGEIWTFGQVDVSNMANGIYLLRLFSQQSGQSVSGKLIIQRP